MTLAGTLSAGAAVTFDASSSQTGGAVSSISWSHTLGAGANRLVVCEVAISNPSTAVAYSNPVVSFGGVTLTAIAGSLAPASGSSKIQSQLFYGTDTTLSALVGPQTVTVTESTMPGGGTAAGCTSFFGVAQSGPYGAAFQYSGSNAPTSTSISVANAGDLIVDGFAGGSTVPATGKTATANTANMQTQSFNVALASAGVLGASSYEFAPASGSNMLGWTDTVGRLGYSMAVFAASSATFVVNTTIAPAGGGTVGLSPAGPYSNGASVTITASPAVGYAFASYSGDVTSTSNPAMFTVNGPKNITANFTAVQCTLTTTTSGSGTGSVTLSPAPTNGFYTCGTQVTVTAVAGSGSSFGTFSGALTGGTNPQTLTLNTSATVNASFVAGTNCTLTTSVTPSATAGSITVSPTGTSFSCGTQITVTATPAQYYSLTGFSGAVSGTTNPQTFTLNANSTITAAFAQTSFPITTTVVGPGTVAASPADTGNGYATGTVVQLTATPNSGSTFSGFSGDLTGTTNPQSITVNAAKNVTATFASALITKDAVSHASGSGASGMLTWNHTIGSGASRALVIAVGEADSSAASPDQAAVVSSVTYNGVYATPVPGSLVYGGTSGMVQSQLFYLLESELPTAGTYPVVVTLQGPVGGIAAGGVSLIGVSQGPPEAVATNKNTSGANLLSTSITTLTNNAWVVDVLEDGDVAVLTANSGQTIAWQAEAPVGTAGSSTAAEPNAGAVTIGWTGNANRLTQSLAAFPPATAIVPATYTLTTSVAGGVGGTVATNPNLSAYPSAAGVLLTATAATGYSFAGWSGDYTSTSNPLPIVMSSNRNVVATFSSAPTCTLGINIIGSGTVTPAAGTYNCGTVIHFVATAASGYTFTSYSGDFSSPDNPADFTITANSNVTVEFDAVPMCTLNLTTAGNGTVTPASGSYACGAVLTLQATAGSGYGFSGYSGDLTSTANPASIQLTQNMNITANFTAGTACTLTSSVTGNGSIVPASGAWACGTTIAIQANPASKYLFNGWGGDLASSGTTNPTTLTLNANKNVTAAFIVNIAGVTGDSRTVTEPTYPPVCTTLTAVQTTGSLVETSPDTARVQAALNACGVGKAVEFAANGSANAFILQPITLPAGVTMIVDPEITIYGSIKSTDYPCSSSSFCTPLIDVAANTAPAPGSGIMGDGVIDGRGGTTLTDLHKSWWGTGSDARPRLVYLSSNANTQPADNFTMYKITLKNSPKFEFSGIGNNLTIWGVKVIAPPDSPNTDGIDPSSSQNITITNSYISTGDDMIAMKAGNGHIANVTISNNHLYSGHGITIGSETNAGLNNMLVIGDAIDNGFGGSSADSLRIKSDTSRGGEVYDVLYKNICIANGGDTIVIDPYYSSETGNLIPNFHDITFSNVHKTIHNSSYKSTWTGYNTNGIVNPLTVTLDTVYFDGDAQNDFKAPDNVNNVQFTFGPGPVSAASFFTVDAATPANLVTVTNSVSNSNAALDCSKAFVYLAGDLTAHASTAIAGSSPTLIAVLQNVVSPLVAGTISYPQQNAPTGTVQLLEGTTVVGSASLVGRLANITIPGVTAGTHTYTAKYLGDTNYSAGLSFGSFTLVVTNAAPVSNSQSVNVAFNTATAITLTATGNGTLTYAVVSSPANGTLSGTAPNLTYTPTAGYSGADSFTFKANNGSDSNVATVSITVAAGSGGGGGTQAQTINFPAPASPAVSGTNATLTASASSGLAITYTVSGPATISGSTVSYTGTGTVTITANQSGNATYAAATPVSQNVTVQGRVYVWLANGNGTVSGVGQSGSPVTGAGTSAANSVLGGVALDAAGGVWSVSSANNTLAFSSTVGSNATVFSGGGLTAPVGVAVDGQGMVWVANSGGNSVSVFSNAGSAQTNAGGYFGLYLSGPSSVVLDASGGVWVTDKSANAVTHVFGAAAPVATPISRVVTSGGTGTRP